MSDSTDIRRGIVQSVDGELATVAVSKRGACDGCTDKHLCFGVGNEKPDIISAINPINATKGQMVEIAMPEGVFLKTAFLIYLLPIICLIAGAFILPEFTTIVDQDLTAVIGSVIGLSLSATFIILYDKKARHNPRYVPRILSVVTVSLGETCCATKR